MELMTCARPYARAVFQFALEKSALEKSALAQQGEPKVLDHWSEVLKAGAAVVSDDAVKILLGNPSTSTAQKVDLLVAVCRESCGDHLDQYAENFIHLLVANKRIALLPLILEQFEQFKAEQEKQIQAEVISAFPLTEQQLAALTEKLQQRLNTKINLTSKVDSSLMGGLVIRAGDLVIDSSVKTRLEKLAEAMLS